MESLQTEQSVVPSHPSNKTAPVQSIAARFEEQAARVPDRLAVKSGSTSYSYQELNQRANRLANTLLGQIGAPGVPVALLFNQEAAIIVAILGVLKAGGFYLALDPFDPAKKLVGLIKESGATALITDTEHLAQANDLAGSEGSVINLDALDEHISTQNPGLQIDPSAYFNLVYTSGSTGKPKGVLQNQRNLIHMVDSNNHRNRTTPEDRFTQMLPNSFGASVSNLFGALLSGASVFPYDLKKNGMVHLARWLQEERISIYQSVPTIFRHLLMNGSESEIFEHMRVIRLGGEPVSKHDVALFRQHFTDACVLQNALGSSEAHIAACYVIHRDTETPDEVLPVGYPEVDTQILILNEARLPVPDGEIGEIAVKSRYLTPGYWRQPHETQASFLPDVTGDERVYLTGDLGRFRSDGLLEHLGRKDLQVKIRGQRVEVTTIENALLSLPGIREAVVAPKRDPKGELRLVAYIVPASGHTPAAKQIRQILAETLPEVMIPSAFMMIGQLPLLPFGKVNRGALPAPDWAQPNTSADYTAPNGLVEERLVKIWVDILGVRQVGTQDNFFELGGTSLTVTQLILQILQEFKIELNIQQIYENPSVAQQAREIESSQQGKETRITTSEEELKQAIRRLGF